MTVTGNGEWGNMSLAINPVHARAAFDIMSTMVSSAQSQLDTVIAAARPTLADLGRADEIVGKLPKASMLLGPSIKADGPASSSNFIGIDHAVRASIETHEAATTFARSPQLAIGHARSAQEHLGKIMPEWRAALANVPDAAAKAADASAAHRVSTAALTRIEHAVDRFIGDSGASKYALADVVGAAGRTINEHAPRLGFVDGAPIGTEFARDVRATLGRPMAKETIDRELRSRLNDVSGIRTQWDAALHEHVRAAAN